MAEASGRASRRRGARRGAAGGEVGALEEWIGAQLPDSGGVELRSGSGGSGWARIYTGELKAPARVEGTAVELRSLFCKVSGGRGAAAMFAGEAQGLRALRAAGDEGLRVPVVVGSGELAAGGASFIVMEKLDIGGGYSMADLGDGLGRMHTAAPLHEEARVGGKFGFTCSNTMCVRPAHFDRCRRPARGVVLTVPPPGTAAAPPTSPTTGASRGSNSFVSGGCGTCSRSRATRSSPRSATGCWRPGCLSPSSRASR